MFGTPGAILAVAGLVLAESLAQPVSRGPSADPADTTIWPNQTSRANSDRWLVENHSRLRRMNPRVLLLNFSNQATAEHLERLTRDLITALAEGSRYHGYRDSNAPAFLNHQVFKFVDLREPDRREGNSAKLPLRKGMNSGFNMEYQAYFSDAFATYYDVRDPKDPARCLRLEELVDRGYVHELWFFAEHTTNMGAYECVEQKPVYDEQLVRRGNLFAQAGNGGDDDQKWIGRSLRIGFINASRGIGCFMESLSHAIEGMANSRAIPYFTRYFYEFASHDLRARYGLPWDSFYPLWGQGKGIDYPDAQTAVITDGQQRITVTNYLAVGGNVHFMPSGRHHYDLDSPVPVMSTIEDWRIGSGPNGQDLAKPWRINAFAQYRSLAPDCMGPWLVYWRQNFPGLDNLQKDDQGQPMKNWWVFLFY
jgi:hypothetical protein